MSAAEVASLLVQAHRSGIRAAVRPELAPRDAAEAYAIQDFVYASVRHGQRPAAWKVGGPSDTVEPTASPILDVLRAPARLAAGGFHMIGIEAEIAYRFSGDVPPRKDPYSEEDLASAVGEALVAIEVCDTRLADWKDAPELWKLADFQSNGCLVAGGGTRGWRAVDFSALKAELILDGKNLVAGARHPYGNPLRLLPWLATHCARRCGGLRAGDLVTTGSWGGMHPIAPGSTVVARFPGIGEARLVFVRG
jgi:2-keto-4-pentenoate hydratase